MKSLLKKVSIIAMIIVVSTGCKKKECECIVTTTTTTTGAPVQTKTIVPDASTGMDAQISSCGPCGYVNSNYGNAVDFLATAWTNGGNSSDGRALIRFDLSAIPSTATVQSAKLSLYHNPTSSNTGHSKLSGSNQFLLQRITSSWSESTVTWGNQPTTTITDQVTVAESTSNTQDYTDIDVTALIQHQVSNPGSNYGLMMRLVTESAYRSVLFCSSDHSDASKHPKLVIDYK